MTVRPGDTDGSLDVFTSVKESITITVIARGEA